MGFFFLLNPVENNGCCHVGMYKVVVVALLDIYELILLEWKIYNKRKKKEERKTAFIEELNFYWITKQKEKE